MKCFQTDVLYFILENNCLFHPHSIITSFANTSFFFICRRLCMNDSAQNNPCHSHIAHALLLFLAYYSWQMNTDHWILFILPLLGPWGKATWSNNWESQIWNRASESQHIVKRKDNTDNYTCQEAVNTWCINSLLRHLLSLGLNPHCSRLFTHTDLPFTAVGILRV